MKIKFLLLIMLMNTQLQAEKYFVCLVPEKNALGMSKLRHMSNASLNKLAQDMKSISGIEDMENMQNTLNFFFALKKYTQNIKTPENFSIYPPDKLECENGDTIKEFLDNANQGYVAFAVKEGKLNRNKDLNSLNQALKETPYVMTANGAVGSSIGIALEELEKQVKEEKIQQDQKNYDEFIELFSSANHNETSTRD